MASMPSEPAAGVWLSLPTIVAPGTPKRCMCVGCETPLPGLENHIPNRRAAERRNSWSSAFRLFACRMLWSTYCTETSAWVRSSPIASSSSITIVPVASWLRVWSIRSPTSPPGTISPSTRCEATSCCVRFRGPAMSRHPFGKIRVPVLAHANGGRRLSPRPAEGSWRAGGRGRGE